MLLAGSAPAGSLVVEVPLSHSPRVQEDSEADRAVSHLQTLKRFSSEFHLTSGSFSHPQLTFVLEHSSVVAVEASEWVEWVEWAA